MRSQDTTMMRRCLDLAVKGERWVAPNPVVGCVIVRNGRIVGEGYHRNYGGPHAEIVALKQAGRRAKGATMYVSLEPCVHTGKTPPCTEAIVSAGIKRVVAASRDPNPLVSGRGFRQLRRAGVRVSTGVLRKEARAMNARFIMSMEKRLPYVGVKLAQTLDGKIADRTGRSKWISSPAARTFGHALRARYHSVLVGAGTVRRDDPVLTVRRVRGRQPVRVVLDGSLSLPLNRHVFDTRRAPTVLLTSIRSLRRRREKVVALERRGVQVLGVEGPERLSARSIVRVLGGVGIASVLVEGGSEAVRSFLDGRLVNRVHAIIAPMILGSGTPSFQAAGLGIRTAIRLKQQVVTTVGPDIVCEGTPVWS